MSSIEKSRKNIEKGIDKNKQESDKFQKKLDQDVKDKDVVKKVADRLKSTGTTEGLQKIKNKGEQAGKQIDKQAQKDHKELDNKVHKEAQNREGKLDKRSDTTRKDSKELNKASSQIKQQEAKGMLNKASNEAKEDADYLKEKKNKQHEIRNQSEKKATEKENKVKSTRPAFH